MSGPKFKTFLQRLSSPALPRPNFELKQKHRSCNDKNNKNTFWGWGLFNFLWQNLFDMFCFTVNDYCIFRLKQRSKSLKPMRQLLIWLLSPTALLQLRRLHNQRQFLSRPQLQCLAQQVKLELCKWSVIFSWPLENAFHVETTNCNFSLCNVVAILTKFVSSAEIGRYSFRSKLFGIHCQKLQIRLFLPYA